MNFSFHLNKLSLSLSCLFVQQESLTSPPASSPSCISRCCSSRLSSRRRWRSCSAWRGCGVTPCTWPWCCMNCGCCWSHLVKVLSCVSALTCIFTADARENVLGFKKQCVHLFLVQWVRSPGILPWYAASTLSVCSCFTLASLSPQIHGKLCSTSTSYGEYSHTPSPS